MARANRLGDKKVQAANTPGMYADGNNLYLQVDRKTDKQGHRYKSWIFRFEVHGKAPPHGARRIPESEPRQSPRVA